MCGLTAQLRFTRKTLGPTAMATPAIQPYVPRYLKMREQQRLDASTSSSGASTTEKPLVLPSSFPVPIAPPGHRRSALVAPHPRLHNHSLLLSTSTPSSSSGSPATGLNSNRHSVVSFHEDNYRDLSNSDAGPNTLDGLTPPASVYSARVPSPLSRSVTDVDREGRPFPPPTLPDISITPPPDQTSFGARLRNSLSISSLRSHSHAHEHATRERQPAIPASSTNSIYSNSSQNPSPNASLLSLPITAGSGLTTPDEKLTALEPPTRHSTYDRARSSQSSLSSAHSTHAGPATSASTSRGLELPLPRRPRSIAESSNRSRRSLPSVDENSDDVNSSSVLTRSVLYSLLRPEFIS